MHQRVKAEYFRLKPNWGAFIEICTYPFSPNRASPQLKAVQSVTAIILKSIWNWPDCGICRAYTSKQAPKLEHITVKMGSAWLQLTMGWTRSTPAQCSGAVSFSVTDWVKTSVLLSDKGLLNDPALNFFKRSNCGISPLKNLEELA